MIKTNILLFYKIYICDSFHWLVRVFCLSVFRTGGHLCVHLKSRIQTPSRVTRDD